MLVKNGIFGRKKNHTHTRREFCRSFELTSANIWSMIKTKLFRSSFRISWLEWVNNLFEVNKIQVFFLLLSFLLNHLLFKCESPAPISSKNVTMDCSTFFCHIVFHISCFYMVEIVCFLFLPIAISLEHSFAWM